MGVMYPPKSQIGMAAERPLKRPVTASNGIWQIESQIGMTAERPLKLVLDRDRDREQGTGRR